MVTRENNKKIDTLQVLRCLAFLGVFIHHVGFENISATGIGHWGVSVFLVLSGFTMMYSYYDKDRIRDVSIIGNVKFAYNKIRRLYPLHVVTTLAMTLFLFVGNDKAVSMGQTFLQIILNLLMVQEYVPLMNRSLNGVSWYLCVTVLSYFLFPWILKYMERRYSVKKAVMWIVFSLAMMVMAGCMSTFMPCSPYDRHMNSYIYVWTNDVPNWFIYYFPLVRIWDIVIGYNTGYIFLHTDKEYSRKGITAVEAVSFALIAVSLAVRHMTWIPDSSDLVTPHPELWGGVTYMDNKLSADCIFFCFGKGIYITCIS